MKLLVLLLIAQVSLATEEEEEFFEGNENCTIYTLSGIIQGVLQKSPRKGYDVEYYPCIPYVKQPSRFGSPEPYEGDITRQLNHPACPNCPQSNPLMANETSEDCLFLHIFVPRHCAKKKSLPVLVYFHGGSFCMGNGPRQSSYLLDECVIVVTVNYRLGPLGFLSLNTPRCSGNAGLKDCLAALEWVHYNIGFFSGNPNDVTIEGMSCGGAIVSYLMMKPEACKYFTKVIADSGIATNPWAFVSKDRALRNAFGLAKLVGCPAGTNDEVCDCLINTSAELLIEKSNQVMTNDQMTSFEVILFGPTEESDLPSAFITDKPRNLMMKEENVCKVKILLGLVEDESCLFKAQVEKYKDALPFLTPKSHKIAPPCLAESNDTDCLKYVSDEMNKFYTGEDSVYNENNTLPVIHVVQFVLDMMAFASILDRYGYEVYLYEFGHLGQCRSSMLYYPSAKKTCHGDQFMYQFVQEPYSSICFKNQNEDCEEVVFSKFLNELYAQFIKTGCPTPVQSKSGLVWPRWTNDDQSYLKLGTEITIAKGVQNEHLSFWKKMIEKCDFEWNYWSPNKQCCSVCDPKYTYPAL